MIIYGSIVNKILQRLKTPRFLWEDCFSEGLLYAVEAVNKYNPSKCSLDKWISIYVHNKMIRYLRNEKQARGVEA
jgi:DNA-directed RNA polymerase specialized sigma subunit